MAQIEIVERRDGEYRLRVGSFDGSTEVVLALGDAAEVSDGRLAVDDATASATVAYLLQHQDAADLPGVVDIGDVVAAYPDAVDGIAALRG